MSDVTVQELALLVRGCIRQERNPFESGWGERDELVEVVDTIKMKEVWEIAGKILAQ